MFRHLFFLYLLIIALVVSAKAQDATFLTLPFTDSSIKMQQGWVYETGEIHSPTGAFDFVNGNLDQSFTWNTFDVVAAADGVAMRSSGGGYGNLVIIMHPEKDESGRNYFTLYAHLADGNINPKLPLFERHNTNYSQWIPVTRGEVLGKAGSTGRIECTILHCVILHFEVLRGGYYSNPTDPYDISYEPGSEYRRNHYPNGTNFNGCGPQLLWTKCPPVVQPSSTPIPPPAYKLTLNPNAYTVTAGDTFTLRGFMTANTEDQIFTSNDSDVIIGEPGQFLYIEPINAVSYGYFYYGLIMSGGYLGPMILDSPTVTTTSDLRTFYVHPVTPKGIYHFYYTAYYSPYSPFNLYKEKGDSLTLHVTAHPNPPAPFISKMAIKPRTNDNQPHQLSIVGDNFQAGNIVQFMWNVPPSNGVWINSQDIPSIYTTWTMDVIVDPIVDNNTIYVRVCRSASQTSSADCSSGTNYIWVATEPPPQPSQTVSSISPTTMTADGINHSLNIYGSNFQAGNIVQFMWNVPPSNGMWNNANYTPSINSTNDIMVSMNPGTVSDTIYVRVCRSASQTSSADCSSGSHYVTVQ